LSAAADTFIPPTIAYAMRCKPSSVPTVKVPVWQLWSNETLETTPPRRALELRWLPKRLHEARSRKEMCDEFCWLLEDEVNNKVRELFGGSARWMIVWPRITFLLAWEGNPKQLQYPPHYVLLVEAEDRKLVMDGTARQLLWGKSSWLQEESWFTLLRVDCEKKPNKGFASDSIQRRSEENSAKVCDGFWIVTRERMTVLIGELDWVELRDLGADKRIARVKSLAEKRFRGAHWEAIRRRAADRVHEAAESSQ
jgi:hypothetical protein